MRHWIAAALLVLSACDFAEGSPVKDPELEQAARDLVALVGGYNCELLPGFLAPEAEALFRSQIDEALMDGMVADPLERVCFVLGVVQDYPSSTTMTVRVMAERGDRVELQLTDGSVEAELPMLRTGGGWKLDHAWALKQVQDLVVHQALRLFAINQDGFYYAGGDRFTLVPEEITEATNIVPDPFGRGIATVHSPPMAVYAALGPGERSVCGSSVSRSGELFMIRQDGSGASSYARGTSLPGDCPDKPLPLESW